MKSSVPRVSVLMPVRNEERYLAAAIQSLCNQTMRDWELVVIDDGSTDSTPSILCAAANSDSRIKILSSNGSGGLVQSLNTGLAACTAPLVARMDGDDISHPRRLELQADYLDCHPDIDLVATSFRHFPQRCIKPGMLSYQEWQNSLMTHDQISADLYVESPFVHPSIMTRRHILLNLGGYRECGWAEDYDLWLRMHLAGCRFARLPEVLLFWRDHPERSTRTMEEYSLAAFRNCKFCHLKNSFLNNTYDIVIAGAGTEGRAWQRIVSSTGIHVSNWLDVDPRKTGIMLHDAQVIHPDSLILNGRKLLVAIGVKGARKQFRAYAATRDWQEGLDFVCVS